MGDLTGADFTRSFSQCGWSGSRGVYLRVLYYHPRQGDHLNGCFCQRCGKSFSHGSAFSAKICQNFFWKGHSGEANHRCLGLLHAPLPHHTCCSPPSECWYNGLLMVLDRRDSSAWPLPLPSALPPFHPCPGDPSPP